MKSFARNLGSTLRASGTTARQNRRIERDAKLLGARINLPGGEATVVPGEAGAKPTSFSKISYSGGVLHLPAGGRKVPVVIDLSTTRIEAGRQYPALRDHDGKKEVGYFVAKIEGNMILADGKFVDNEHSDRIRDNAAKGFSWQASVGMDDVSYEPVKAGAKVTLNGRTFTGPFLIARNGLLRESSFVAVGADAETSVSLAASRRDDDRNEERSMEPEFVTWLEASGWGDYEELTAAQIATLKASWAQQSLKAKGEKIAGFDEEETRKAVRSVAVAEANRIASINSLKAEFSLGEVEIPTVGKADFASHAIEAGWSKDEAELFALRASRSNAPAPRGGSSGSQDKIDAETIETSLLLAGGMSEKAVGLTLPEASREKVMNEAMSLDYRGMGLKGLLRASIHAAGMSSGRFSAYEDEALIDAANRAQRKLTAAGEFSTISLPNVLGNVARKTLAQSYQAASLTWRLIAAPASLKDFKPVSTIQMDINGGFTKVGQDGELKHVGLQETARTLRLETAGAMIGLTRQMIINDDLRAFMRIPTMFGRQAALYIERGVYVVLHAGVDTTLFTPALGNIVEGTGNVLGATGLGAAITAFRNLKDANGQPILVDPETLLTGTALEWTAKTLLNSAETRNTTSSTKEGTANPFQGVLKLAVSPYVSDTTIGGADAAKRYFLLADPAVIAVVEVGFLNGRQTPVIESDDQDFNVLGTKWRSYFDVGFAEGDPKGGVAVTGIA